MTVPLRLGSDLGDDLGVGLVGTTHIGDVPPGQPSRPGHWLSFTFRWFPRR
jgi:hypothetical protein